MDLLEKYKIKIIDGKRYYELDLNNNFYGTELEDTVPYLFQYKDKIIKKSYWGGMAIEILTYIDELTPKTYEQLLVLTYDFCKSTVFSRVKRTNFTKFKDIYLNTNHTAGHAFRSIKTLLRAYNINFDECYFLSRKHINTEPDEVKENYKEETIKEYKYFSLLRGCPANKLDSFVNNIEVLNKQLSKIGTSMNDLFLFDNYIDYYNVKCKLVSYIIDNFPCQNNYINAAKNNLFYLEKFYKYRSRFSNLKERGIDYTYRHLLDKHLKALFDLFKVDKITCKELYQFIKENDINLYNSFNNFHDFCMICDILISKDYKVKIPYILKKG
ncbi:MAG: hypothetical protein RRZ92_01780 [Bacilli bacterium]